LVFNKKTPAERRVFLCFYLSVLLSPRYKRGLRPIKNTDVTARQIKLFIIIIAMTGLAMGLSDSVFANYFKDAYGVDAFGRGVIEFPRELPGLLCVFIVSVFAGAGDIRLSIVAQLLMIAGLIFLGLFTPAFGVMLVALFINSLGMHMFMPLSDSIGLSLAKKGSFGSRMGAFNGIRTAFAMLAAIFVFAGFRAGFFSFTSPVKLIFLIAAAALCVVAVCLALMRSNCVESASGKKFSLKPNLVFRKEYMLYYLLAVLFGARKQIMYVYGPWVLIELMGFGADRMSLLVIAGAGIGIFFLPTVGKWIDRFGPARIMLVEAVIFIFIYAVYGVMSAFLAGGLAAAGIVVVLAFGVNIADRMTMQFGMVRAVYMRSIALKKEDVTPTLSTGMALDHALSIISAFACGFIWRELGPQYVFVFAGLLCAGNIAVARRVAKNKV